MSERPGVGTCSYGDCGDDVLAKGLCKLHYHRQRTGKPMDGPKRSYSTGPRAWGFEELASKPITTSGAHQRVRRVWGSASQYPCVECGEAASDWAYDGTDPTHIYEFSRKSWCHFSRWPEFYMPMCRSCHSDRDRSLAATELREYREWKMRNPGKTLADLEGVA